MAVENDVVLIYVEDTPVTFARIEAISSDAKKDWYHVKLLMLQIPMQSVTWILKNDYINGDEFHMGGKRMKLELVKCPPDETDLNRPPFSGQKETPAKYHEVEGGAKIISFSDIQKARKDDDTK